MGSVEEGVTVRLLRAFAQGGGGVGDGGRLRMAQILEHELATLDRMRSVYQLSSD